jgi:hypothetical protein
MELYSDIMVWPDNGFCKGCNIQRLIVNKRQLFTIERVYRLNQNSCISYEKELDTDNKLRNYLKITGILNNVFRSQKALKKTRIKLYNTLALQVLLYGSETWTINARDARRITAAEMKYMRRTAGYTWTD